MTTIAYLTIEELVLIGEYAIGHEPKIRDWGLLESALGRPQATVYGQDAYPTIHEKAAALLHSVASNHALVDGNKRLGWVATRTFYRLNGYDVRASEDEAFDLVVSIADGTVSDVEEIAKAIRVWVVSRPVQ